MTDKDVHIEPKILQFDDAYVGIPKKQVVTVRYRKDKHLIFLMFNSKSIHFHCSFANNKVSFLFVVIQYFINHILLGDYSR